MVQRTLMSAANADVSINTKLSAGTYCLRMGVYFHVVSKGIHLPYRAVPWPSWPTVGTQYLSNITQK
jgi:hypothetical protein